MEIGECKSYLGWTFAIKLHNIQIFLVFWQNHGGEEQGSPSTMEVLREGPPVYVRGGEEAVDRW